MAAAATIAAEMELNMEEMYMDELDFMLKKKYGYWGWRYITYLAENHVEAWYLFMSRDDCAEVIATLNVQCRFRMKILMEGTNSHDAKDGMAAEVYRCMVNSAKRIVFEDCLELLKYTAWMEEAPKLKELLDEFEEEDDI